MRRQLIVWLIIVSLFLVAIAAEYLVWPRESASILYALPLAVAARYGSPRAVIGVAALALVLNTPSALSGRIPWELMAIKYVSLGLIAVLAFWVAKGRQDDAHRLNQLGQAQEQLREFMGLVVHDLRNPLSVALGYLQLVHLKLMAENLDEVAERLKKSQRALVTMRRLIDDLADAVRIGGNRFVVRRSPCDFAELTRSVVEEQAAAAPRHHLVVVTPEHLCIDGDPDRLRQVVTNLLTNAVKYSPEGSEVSVTISERDDGAMLAVRDQGRGIPAESMDQLFQPFSRLSQAGAATGTGLGLYITKGIVEAHDGRIWVTSSVGHGSTFFVELPHRCH